MSSRHPDRARILSLGSNFAFSAYNDAGTPFAVVVIPVDEKLAVGGDMKYMKGRFVNSSGSLNGSRSARLVVEPTRVGSEAVISRDVFLKTNGAICEHH